MMKIHGDEVVGYLKKSADEAVILVDRGEGTYDRWVTGIIRGDDPNPAEWFWGHYFNSYDRAVRDLLIRARTGLFVELPKQKYCEGCEAAGVTLTHKGYCRECVDAARDAGYLSFVQ